MSLPVAPRPVPPDRLPPWPRTFPRFARQHPPRLGWPGLFPRPAPAYWVRLLPHQDVPLAPFHAVDQRGHHAFRPDRGFHPRYPAGFCALFSPIGHCRCCLHSCLSLSFTHPPSYPPSLLTVLLPVRYHLPRSWFRLVCLLCFRLVSRRATISSPCRDRLRFAVLWGF